MRWKCLLLCLKVHFWNGFDSILVPFCACTAQVSRRHLQHGVLKMDTRHTGCMSPYASNCVHHGSNLKQNYTLKISSCISTYFPLLTHIARAEIFILGGSEQLMTKCPDHAQWWQCLSLRRDVVPSFLNLEYLWSLTLNLLLEYILLKFWTMRLSSSVVTSLGGVFTWYLVRVICRLVSSNSIVMRWLTMELILILDTHLMRHDPSNSLSSLEILVV